jgi:cytochrome d ubiquinol oxidase subunit I
MRTALICLFITSVGQWAIGHWHTVVVVEEQPVKLAAFEGLYHGTEGAGFAIFGIPNTEAEKLDFAIEIPNMLSFLATGKFSGPDSYVKGLYDEDLWEVTRPGYNAITNPNAEYNLPPIALSFFSYRTMIALGTFFLLFSLAGIYLQAKKKLETSRKFLKLAIFSIPLGVIAAEVGWMAAEIGRQPWSVYKLMLTSDAASNNINASQVLLSIVLFLVLYILLCAAWIFLIRHKMHEGPDAVLVKKSRAERRMDV